MTASNSLESRAVETASAPVKLESTSAVVYLEYDDINSLPPKPSEHWTRFVCVSDTHSRVCPVPPGDVLLHGGDLTGTGKYREFRTTMDWLCSLPHAHKIIVAGNHDLPLHSGWYDENYYRWHPSNQEELEPILELLKGPAAQDANLVYLQDERYEFRTKDNGRLWSVYGSPWSPAFCNWAFNYERGLQADRLINAFPKTDILITHGPPYDTFDKTLTGEKVGCEVLAARLPFLRPRLHLFGHIHEAHGAEIRAWPSAETVAPVDKSSSSSDVDADRTVFVNAANWPSGPRGGRGKSGKVEFGHRPFQPAVIDLLDSI